MTQEEADLPGTAPGGADDGEGDDDGEDYVDEGGAGPPVRLSPGPQYEAYLVLF